VKKIKSARITEQLKTLFDTMPAVFVTLEGEDTEQRLFFYFPDEISFRPEEFIGKTLEEAHALRHKRDVAYLQAR